MHLSSYLKMFINAMSIQWPQKAKCIIFQLLVEVRIFCSQSNYWLAISGDCITKNLLGTYFIICEWKVKLKYCALNTSEKKLVNVNDFCIHLGILTKCEQESYCPLCLPASHVPFVSIQTAVFPVPFRNVWYSIISQSLFPTFHLFYLSMSI